jgi:hypothetical protein
LHFLGWSHFFTAKNRALLAGFAPEGDWRHRLKEGLAYEDLMARVTGPAVLELPYVFAADWFLETIVSPPSCTTAGWS